MKKTLSILLSLGIFFIFSSYGLSLEPSPQEIKDGEYIEYIMYFYINPEPTKAPQVLERFIASDIYKDKEARANNVPGLTAHAFGRIADLYPEVKSQYKTVFEKSDHEGRIFILAVFSYCADEKDRAYFLEKADKNDYSQEKNLIAKIFGTGVPSKVDLLGREIKKGGELDFYWNEFFITGNTGSLNKILNVVAWPEKSRQKIETYLKGNNPQESKKSVKRILESFEILTNGNEIILKDDIDIKIAFAIMMLKKGDLFKKLKEIVPFSDEEFLYIATKGAVAWAMGSNASQHEKVQRFLESEIPNLDGAVLIRTLLMASYAELERGEVEPALENVDKCLQLDPSNIHGHHLRMVIQMKMGNASEVKKEEAIIQQLSPELLRFH